MALKEQTSTQLLRYQLFKDLKHATVCSTYSKGNLHALFDLNVDPLLENPKAESNLRLLCQHENLKHPVYAKQVHGSDLKVITDKNINESHVCDGFITNNKHVTLCIKHADCQAAFFYDPIKNVIALVHCGWKGNILNIYGKTVSQMREEFHSNPKDIKVSISPSLGPHHSEFTNYQKEWPAKFWKYRDSSNYFDLWKMAKDQLMDSGIETQHIEISGLCTFTHKDRFFSYRRDKTKLRNLSFLSLAPSH